MDVDYTWLSCCPIKGRKFSDVIYGRSLIVKNNIHLFLSFFLNWFKLMRSWNYSLVLNYDGFVITHLIDSACIGFERWRNRLGGRGAAPQILADQLTLSQPGKADYHTTLLLPPTIFSDLPPSLVVLIPGYVQYDSHNLILLLNYYWKVIFFSNAIMQEIRPCFRQWKLWNQQIIFQERKDCLDAGRTHFHGISSGWALVSICLCILW